MLNLPGYATRCQLCNWTSSCATGSLMHNLLRHSYPVVQPDGLKATRLYNRMVSMVVQLDGSDSDPVMQVDGLKLVQLDMQFPCNIRLRWINRNPSVLFIKGEVELTSLHPHNGQIASHSKISVLARGMLRTIWLHNGMTHLHNWMSGCTTVWNIKCPRRVQSSN